MLYAILTHNFRILCFEDGRLTSREIINISDLSEVAYLSQVMDKYSFTNDKQNLWYDFELNTINRSIPNGFITLENAHPDIYRLRYNSSFVQAHKYNKNTISFVETSSPLLWEEFRLLTIKELSALIQLVQNKWHIVGNKNVLQVNSDSSTQQHIAFGDLLIDFNEFLDAIDNNNEYNGTILNFSFNIGWRAYKAYLIKPAIIYILFGQGEVLNQFKVSLQSLTLVGNYSNDIFIVTNTPPKDLQSYIPEKIAHKVHFIDIQGYDKLDFYSTRINILSSGILDSYQPILYSDLDIIFDKDIYEFLQEAATAKQCSAQIEPYNLIQDCTSTGGVLFQQDTFDIPKTEGFNSGILLIPNMKYHKNSFKTAFKTINNYTSTYGRFSIPYPDQNVLNYVLYKLQDFNPSPVTERTQVGGDAIVTLTRKLDHNNPKGFVHFWNSYNKSEDMKNYMDAYLVNKKS
ncbi:glycosyltransferase [Commensalibacter nepenthis]|uniref:Glycosyltransferase n=1 Tax=Commensalibacter nepenthis TaxID=3043872 RepID=A0ABT6Q7E8_9PROT|nr:glycosyltransferase [Commensalibacter sp. TBRC 10068]MDI2112804.1 glycosyltransferase [Commensalibacter sp. TBRC 10068]